MKKIIALIAMFGLLATSGIAFAQEDYELLIVFESDPKSTDNMLLVDLGDEISFTRKVVSIGMADFTWEWSYDSNVLDCEPMPEIDSPDLECTIIGDGLSDVSYTAYATMDDDSEMTATSKTITVSVGDYLPEVPDYYGHPNFEAIEYLYTEGIVEGFPDGTFKPENNLTRAELMKILVLAAMPWAEFEEDNTCFPDVNNEWFAKYVCYAANEGWVEGYPDGEFKPGENVLKVEAIKMIIEVFNFGTRSDFVNSYEDVPEDAWFYPYVSSAEHFNLLEEEGGLYNPGAAITRGQVSENIYRATDYLGVE